MTEMKLIYGKKSIRYNHFKEYELISCRAVATRLMGVTALKLIWRGTRDRREHFYQVIHLDWSEYGVDEYREYECTPGDPDYSDKKRDMNALWTHFIAVMGGDVVQIDASCMLRLVESALPLAAEDRIREYDSDENAQFRAYARMRLGLMQDALNSRGITSADCSLMDAIECISPGRLSAYETINYFVMRIVDLDFDAASYLTSMDRDVLPDIELAGCGVQTLVKCDIEKSSRQKDPAADGKSYPFRCRITTLAKDSYYHSTFIIWLSGSIRSRNPVVTDLKVGSVIKLSHYEAALQIDEAEYLTVFDCNDSMLKGFDSKFIKPFSNSTAQAVPNGWLYASYKPNNSHVDSAHYRMNEDIYGYMLLSIAGELVLMSPDLNNISLLDDEVIFSMYSPFISTKGRYRIDSSVFQTLCQTPGALFDELVVPEDE